MPRPKVDPFDDFDTRPPVHPIVRLWMSRLLVPLGVIRQLTVSKQVGFDGVLVALGLWDTASAGSEDLPTGRALARQLRALHRDLEAGAKFTYLPKALARNLNALDDLLGLDPVERQLLAFMAFNTVQPELNEVVESLGRLSWPRLIRALATVLGVTEPAVAKALTPRSALVASGLLRVWRKGSEGFSGRLRMGSEDLAEALLTPGADMLRLLRGCVDESPPAVLAVADFTHVGGDLALLLPYLRQALQGRRLGVNVLLHGPAGVGKTEMSRAVAAALGVPLYLVCTDDDKGKPLPAADRLAALGVAQTLLARTSALLLFDEAQDVFDARLRASTPALGHKGWINQQLESNAVPTIWVSNQVGELDAAFLRRFDFIIPMRPPTAAQRAGVLQRAAPGLPLPLVQRVARIDGLPPAVLARAAEVVAMAAQDAGADGPVADAAAQAAAVLHLVGRSAQAMGIELPRHWCEPAVDVAAEPARAFDPATAALSEADQRRLTGLVGPLRQRLPICVLLSGPPGGGKSAASEWLAAQAGLGCIVVPAATLVGPWPDAAAALLAAAVQRAFAEGAILVMEDVDLALAAMARPADGPAAQAGAAGAALLLAAIERSVVPVLLTSRNPAALDEAVRLRVDVELRFGRLRPAQAVALLRSHAGAVGVGGPEDELPAGWPGPAALTPGDIAAAVRSARLQQAKGMAALAADVLARHAHRDDAGQRPLGFACTPA